MECWWKTLSNGITLLNILESKKIAKYTHQPSIPSNSSYLENACISLACWFRFWVFATLQMAKYICGCVCLQAFIRMVTSTSSNGHIRDEIQCHGNNIVKLQFALQTKNIIPVLVSTISKFDFLMKISVQQYYTSQLNNLNPWMLGVTCSV